MDPSKHHTTPGGWDWPEDIKRTGNGEDTVPQASSSQANSAGSPDANTTSTSGAQTGRKRTRTHWPPRTCRICLETVQPTYHPPNENIPNMFQSGPNVTYESEEGRLIRPCKCKGSQRYVHEGCLQSWRHADPSYGRRNYVWFRV